MPVPQSLTIEEINTGLNGLRKGVRVFNKSPNQVNPAGVKKRRREFYSYGPIKSL